MPKGIPYVSGLDVRGHDKIQCLDNVKKIDEKLETLDKLLEGQVHKKTHHTQA